ncbi:MAG: ATP-binding protein [Candidatus Hydrogenedentes bacterium]|nr:ATP-binding protein [Candidatus Hydrogenedentota bacterium]
MKFIVLSHTARLQEGSTNTTYLRTDNWNDWGKYKTLYHVHYYDGEGVSHSLGSVKIGQFNMLEGQERQERPELPDSFERLDGTFFSLGQDAEYYQKVYNLGPELQNEILSALQDVVLNHELYDKAATQEVMGESLLRSVTESSVKGQFRRVIDGGARLSKFQFDYVGPKPEHGNSNPVKLEFSVIPESKPPTNIHVLIGRNGVGKTYLLNAMTRALVEEGENKESYGKFLAQGDQPYDEGEPYNPFASIVSVTFSAFDPFDPLPENRNATDGARYSYVGLKKIRTASDSTVYIVEMKGPDALAEEFARSARNCVQGARADRWRKALETLESDSIFQIAEVANLTSDDGDDEFKCKASKIFTRLSSGHKIVLLTITRLVEKVEERTLVIIDEPEAHLHPPLLSAFVRALSDLLINRNGVAVIATHSPVVLQEVPKSCVWKIMRNGHVVKAKRPQIETFAENVGILTREIFGLEVTESGFHKMLADALEEDDELDDMLDKFDGEVGSEGHFLIQSLIAVRNVEKEN